MILRTGVALAAAVVTLGVALYLSRHGGEPADLRTFRGEPVGVRNLGDIVRGALALQSHGVLQLGVVLLISTPVLRVAFSVAAFTAERDWMYVAFTLVVLGLLLYSLFGPYV